MAEGDLDYTWLDGYLVTERKTTLQVKMDSLLQISSILIMWIHCFTSMKKFPLEYYIETSEKYF